MNRKKRTYFATVALAAYFFLAGAGWNLVRFCCSDCERAGIERVASASCEAVHHDPAQHPCAGDSDDMACSDLQHHTGDCCHVLRLVLDNMESEHELQLPCVASFAMLSGMLPPDLSTGLQFFPRSDAFVLAVSGNSLSTGRSVLLSNCVLLL